ncbi:MAG TPA: hypothetical protein VKP30_19305 [Polyangiaceae bacterium]|nr:hypothetical protein [Polyangiaceae bacterium]
MSWLLVGKDADSTAHTYDDGTSAAHRYTKLSYTLSIALRVTLERVHWCLCSGLNR